jgi:hypothetical protein
MMIVRDTREKEGYGWFFEESQYCEGTQLKKLDSGDYSIAGRESVVAIERKESIVEFAQNLTQDRFERELERMEQIEHPYVVLEFRFEDLVQYPYSAQIPPNVKSNIKITGQYLLRRLCELQIKYKTKFIFAGKFGKQFAESLFKRFNE